MDPRDPRYQEWLAQQGQHPQQPQQQQQQVQQPPAQPVMPPIYGWGDQQPQARPPQQPPQANWPPQAPPQGIPRAPAPGYIPFEHDPHVQMMRDAHRSSGHRMMITGGIIALVGIIITAATYSAASEGGGTYLICYGPIIGGVVTFFKGVARAAG